MFLQRRSGAEGVANKLFIAFLFSDPKDDGVLFLRDVRLIPSSMVCCKCGSRIFWCVDTSVKTVTVGYVLGPYLLPYAVLQSQLRAVLGFSRVA
jgi:hypothetical protein